MRADNAKRMGSVHVKRLCGFHSLTLTANEVRSEDLWQFAFLLQAKTQLVPPAAGTSWLKRKSCTAICITDPFHR